MFKRIFAAHAVLFLLFTASAANASAAPQDQEMKKWEKFDFSEKLLTRAQVKNLRLEELKLMRGIIFGRHGRIFKDWEVKYFLQGRDWYRPNPDFSNSSLNEKERRNLDLIREMEARRHETIEPGDMRWWRNRLIKRANLGERTGAEWRILRAEIEAIRGRRFDDQPWLQEYFEDRYWYKADPNYDPKRLSAVERRNMATIEAERKRQRNVALSPGDMEHFQRTLITEKMLQGLSIHELRLLRNEIYARRGRQFRIDWLAQHFYNQPWYEPTEEFAEPELSEIERKNVETIVAYENRLREDLSAKPITAQILEGVFLEDAQKLRHEIYARRGKVFRDKWLQKYFESFPWYKPDPDFKEEGLSRVEKRNVETILAYEKKALSVLDAIEG